MFESHHLDEPAAPSNATLIDDPASDSVDPGPDHPYRIGRPAVHGEAGGDSEVPGRDPPPPNKLLLWVGGNKSWGGWEAASSSARTGGGARASPER